MCGHVRERNRLLFAGREALEPDAAVAELVADDHGVGGAALGGRFELLAELAAAAVRTDGEAGLAECGGDPQAVGVVVPGSDDRDERAASRDCNALLLHGQHGPVQADPEPDARRRPAAEVLGEPVVAATATERLLLPLAAGDD